MGQLRQPHSLAKSYTTQAAKLGGLRRGFSMLCFHSLVLNAFCECVIFYFSTLCFHSFTLVQLRCAHPYASLSHLTVADCVRPPQMLTNSRPVSGSMDCQD